MTKLRSPEQQLKKMLNEEKMILGLELAIKKEEFKKNQFSKQELDKMTLEGNDSQTELISIPEMNPKSNRLRSFLLNKIGF